MAISENLIKSLKDSSVLFASLHGVRTVLERELSLSNILIATDDTIVAEMKRKGHVEYPHAYITMDEIIGVKDQSSNKTMQRLGATTGMESITKATTGKAHMFPVNVGLGFKYTDNDPKRLVIMAEALVILSMIGGLSFSINVGGLEWIVRIEIPENTAIPLASAEAANEPSGTEISVNMVIHTFAGFFVDVAAVQSSTPNSSLTITKL